MIKLSKAKYFGFTSAELEAIMKHAKEKQQEELTHEFVQECCDLIGKDIGIMLSRECCGLIMLGE